MKLKIIFICFFIMSFYACSNDKKNEIPLFNQISFELYNGETESSITAKIKNKYEDYFNNDSIQVPLYKYIKHQNYEIFIGLPFNTTKEALILKSKLNNRDSLKNVVESDSVFSFNTYSKNEYYITEYVSEIDSSLIFIASMSKSKAVSDSIFTELKQSNRIFKK